VSALRPQLSPDCGLNALRDLQVVGIPLPARARRSGTPNWHSASFTWDGEVLILGWEPGGGAAPECEATDPPVTKSAFFYNAHTGEKLEQWTLARPQSAEENCTIHNYNVVPIRGRYILTSGNYQAGPG
jgi:hypothetical protein